MALVGLLLLLSLSGVRVCGMSKSYYQNPAVGYKAGVSETLDIVDSCAHMNPSPCFHGNYAGTERAGINESAFCVIVRECKRLPSNL